VDVEVREEALRASPAAKARRWRVVHWPRGAATRRAGEGVAMEEYDEMADEALLNLSAKNNEELRSLLDELSAEEHRISYRRRVLHGRIDILRAELVRRLSEEVSEGHDVISGADIDKLIQILAADLRVAKPEMEFEDLDEEDV
jgi:hypothetical protein